jgi:hypothetical protein
MKWTNVLAFFESVDAWIMKHPRGACASGWLCGMALCYLLMAG